MRKVEKKRVSKCCKCQLQAYVLHLLKQEVRLRKPISMGKTGTVRSGLSSSPADTAVHSHILCFPLELCPSPPLSLAFTDQSPFLPASICKMNFHAQTSPSLYSWANLHHVLLSLSSFIFSCWPPVDKLLSFSALDLV